MQQLVQSLHDGELSFIDVGRPLVGAAQVLVATEVSTISSGTERAARELARASLLAKARQRPDLVRAVLDKARAEGAAAASAAVQRRLAEQQPLGYAGTGVVLEAGEAAHVRPGQRVATAGAPHGHLQLVATNLCIPVPDGVDAGTAALAALGAIALEAVRLADVGPGASVAVLGLGLVGQLTARAAAAAGCRVAGADPDADRLALAAAAGAHPFAADEPHALDAWTRARGVDAVLVCATEGPGLLDVAAALCRDRGTIVVVGDVPLELGRRAAYERGLTVRVARSYGPGRYDPTYEELGIDYPVGATRWTAGRNLEAYLDLVASGRLPVRDLITHRFPFERAADAYALLERHGTGALGVQLDYPTSDASPPHRSVAARSLGATSPGVGGIGLLGAGTFVRATLLDALERAGLGPVVAVASARGAGAAEVAQRLGTAVAVDGLEDLLADERVTTVVVATPHAEHAEQAVAALEAGRHVWCEKPLAIDVQGLRAVDAAWLAGEAQLAVGFNRRHAPLLQRMREQIVDTGAAVITYRVRAGALPSGHWLHDPRHGGRLLGEVCHMIDTCCALVGDVPLLRVHAAAGSVGDELLLADDVAVTLTFSDGSIAAITYGSTGHPGTSKERIEVLAGGHTLVLDDFRALTIDGRRGGTLSRGAKGHAEALSAFSRACRAGDDAGATRRAIASTAAALAAAESLRTGNGEAPIL
jgi:predicted dehydrogenase